MKGQIHAIREVLFFAIGVALVISIFYIFSEILKPIFSDYAVEEYLKDVTITTNFGIQQSFSSLSEISEKGNSTIEIEMPPKIGGMKYMVYFSDKEVCSKTIEEFKKYCMESVVNNPKINLTGIFHSSKKKLKIDSWKNKDVVEIKIS